jgi:hypothetical protein
MTTGFETAFTMTYELLCPHQLDLPGTIALLGSELGEQLSHRH